MSLKSPVSILHELAAKRHMKSPEWAISLTESGYCNRARFMCTVEFNGRKVVGIGSSKKFAKRNAAIDMLELCGFQVDNFEEGETEINTGTLPPPPEMDELIVSEIHMALNASISENSMAWAPIISTWSLELLGEISTKFSGRAHISANFNEMLHLWTACRATRTLVDINTKCLSSLIHSNTEACISALLDTSVKHSPHFDWVVAHVGSCFPNTVITRVLSVGLKDFCQDRRGFDEVQNSPKLKSVVGILGHLAGSHARDIRNALIEIFQWSLIETFEDTDMSRLQKKATVPYILQLISLSNTLLWSICDETKNILSVEVIGNLHHFIDDWIKYFGTPEALEEHIISLIVQCRTGGLQIFDLLLKCVKLTKLKGCNDSIKTDIREKALEFIEFLHAENFEFGILVFFLLKMGNKRRSASSGFSDNEEDFINFKIWQLQQKKAKIKSKRSSEEKLHSKNERGKKRQRDESSDTSSSSLSSGRSRRRIRVPFSPRGTGRCISVTRSLSQHDEHTERSPMPRGHEDEDPLVVDCNGNTVFLVLGPENKEEPHQDPLDNTDNEPKNEALDVTVCEKLGTRSNDPVFGEPLHDILASQYEGLIKSGLVEEDRNDLLKKYLLPENCKYLEPPKCNTQIYSALNESGRKRDDKLRVTQTQIGIALAASAKVLSKLLKMEKTEDILSLIEGLSDYNRLLADWYHSESMSRRSIITGFSLQGLLPTYYKDALNNAKLDEWLFGEDLTERIKEAKVMERNVTDLKSAKKARHDSRQGRKLTINVGAGRVTTTTANTTSPRDEKKNPTGDMCHPRRPTENIKYILLDIEESVRYGEPVEILSSFSKDISEINSMLLDNDEVISQVAWRLILCLGYQKPSVLVQSVTHILNNATTADQLGVIFQILTSELINKSLPSYREARTGIFTEVLKQILQRHIQIYTQSNEETLDLTQMWTNLLCLLEWEKGEKVPHLRCPLITRALEENFVSLTSVFASEVHHMHVIAEILDKTEIPTSGTSFNPPIEAILNLTQGAVNYFFACCADDGTSKKLKGFKRSGQMLKRLCIYSKVAKVQAVRELLERALFRSDNVLFGTKHIVLDEDEEREESLLQQNRNINKTIPLTKHSTVFNGGIIGTGKRKARINNEVSADVVAANTSELIGVLKSCCALTEENKFLETSLDSMTLLSLTLVQFVSPDVTMERDLAIRKMFTDTPLLWDLLSFVAVHRPALCYCSVLIRALTATLIHQWKSMGDEGGEGGNKNYKILLDTTVKVVSIMALGQLLPPPLSNIGDVLPHLRCLETVDILRDCVWCYLRDHIPSPALFTCDSNGIYWRDPVTARPPERYTNTLRIIMQRNMETLGHLLSEMFVNIPRHD
ncbi:unnamed protein product [Ceutorhynchus assimilis]|uniref:DRBM domain-containing protein n=1 Tax=Ceutorhynchus assimilis TaxID=467358 RepID=A0A9N9MLH7_9CUCU|nr:unnamed protein product [Ceutorhynchus assimilis]